MQFDFEQCAVTFSCSMLFNVGRLKKKDFYMENQRTLVKHVRKPRFVWPMTHTHFTTETSIIIKTGPEKMDSTWVHVLFGHFTDIEKKKTEF